MSVSKLTNAEARRLLDMTKRSLIAELNFPTRGDEKEFDVVGDTKKDIFAIKIYRGKIQPFKYNIGARIKKNGTMLLELHINPSNVHRNPDAKKIVVVIGIYTQKSMDALMLFQQKMSKKMLLSTTQSLF